MMKRAKMKALILLIQVLCSSVICHSDSYDLLVYSSTPAGVAAAIAAKVSGADRVLLLEPTGYVGGMASPGGIGLRDCEMDEIRTNNSTQHEWALRNGQHYGLSTPVWQPDNWVGEMSFIQMLFDYQVELRLNTNFKEGSEGVKMETDKSGLRRIKSIILESGESLESKYFIDASYEGELMIATGHVQYTYGREAKSVYNETYAGITKSSLAQFNVPVDPYVVDLRNSKSLIKYVQNNPDPRENVGEGDESLMAYSFRACLTNNADNRVPFSEPQGYDPRDFELSRRLLLQDLTRDNAPLLPWGNLNYMKYPKGNKFDACCGSASVGIDAVGLAVGYATANRTERQEIYNKHKYYVQGLMWFWTTDPSVPESIREEMKSFGLCKDEWPDNAHFPPQLYVREAVRMVGDRVFTQQDRVPAGFGGTCLNDSIGLGAWGFDFHDMQRVAVIDNETGDHIVFNEGLTSADTGGAFVYELPYYVVLPKRGDLINLAVPNCPSVSHVTFSAVRVEPTLWQLGQGAGTAAAIGVQEGGRLPLQDISVNKIQQSLLTQGSFVHWPPINNC